MTFAFWDSSKLDVVSVCLEFFSCHLLLMIFVVLCIFFILSLFLNCCRFFVISVNSSWFFCCCCMLRHILRVGHCYVFGGCSSFNGIFLLIWILYLLVLLDIPSGEGLSVIFLGNFVGAFCSWLWCIFYVLGYKGWFYAIFGIMTFEMEVLSVCGFVVNTCDNLAISVFNVYV